MSDAGARPELRWIDKRKLAVDHRYQRTIEGRKSQNLIARIAAEFSWFHCSAIVVAPGDGGKFNILDGQHRHAAAMRRADIKELPCIVSQVRDLGDQARAFIALNRDRVQLNSLSIFWSEVVAGVPDAKALVSACREAGVVILKNPAMVSKLKPNETMALGALMRLYRGQLGGGPGGRRMVFEILALIREAYPETPGQLGSNMIQAVTMVLANQAKRRVVLAALKTTDAQSLMAEAMALRLKDKDLRVAEAMYRALWAHVVKTHNKMAA